MMQGAIVTTYRRMMQRGLQAAVEEENDDEYVPFVSPAERKRLEQRNRAKRAGVAFVQEKASSNVSKAPGDEAAVEAVASSGVQTEKGESLLSIVKRMRKEEELDPEAVKRRKAEEEEARILESAMAASTQALISAQEHAKDVKFRERTVRKWKGGIPETEEVIKEIQDSKLILVDGKEVPLPISKFENMNLPEGIVKWLIEKSKIEKPTPIQMQGIPVMLSGRDMIGVASTGSGKTLTFLIPSIVCCLEQEEIKGRLRVEEGPFVLILGPSRELQRQTYQIAVDICSFAFGARLSCSLAIGGESKALQLTNHRNRGTHILFGTPGRVADFLTSKSYNLRKCDLLVLDEGDRMLDEGFDEEVKKIIGHFQQRKRQTVLFSATMPYRVVNFAREALVDTVVVNVGRAGAASSNITQYVEAVKREDRFLSLLEALERTTPPVVVFCTKNSDVDDVHEYLLLKGVEARGIHSGKSQQDRNSAVDDFKAGNADVLVASDVAAKGLDFPQIAHVINFDLPSEIEQYVHRIGRTGRGGKSGVATTFVDMTNPNYTLLGDLSGILREAKQRVPLFLVGGEMGEYEEPTNETESTASLTCSVCGGFGHRVINCPKLSIIGRKNQTRDMVIGGDY